MYTAGIDLGQHKHVLYPLCDLICTIFNSRPSEELTFHLSCCYFAAGAACYMCEIWRIHIGVWPMYTAGIDLGQLMHVLYPLCNLICAIFNSSPSGELTFHLSYCYFAASAACDMREICRIHIGVWPMYTAGIDLGQLMHVLYPLCNLICAIFNSRPSEELTSCSFFMSIFIILSCTCTQHLALLTTAAPEFPLPSLFRSTHG